MKHQLQFEYEILESISRLNAEDARLLQQARECTATAYAPYSNFKVAAVARLVDGSLVTGTNQENASYPVGICAERVLLSALSSAKPGIAIDTIAISYQSDKISSVAPISPCGICRQSLQEYAQRQQRPIRLILAGLEGAIYVLPDTALLLPLAFSADAMK